MAYASEIRQSLWRQLHELEHAEPDPKKATRLRRQASTALTREIGGAVNDGLFSSIGRLMDERTL